MIKVRFHLAKGKNYQQWQVRDGDEVSYFNPEEVSLVLEDTKLVNHSKGATKIWDGANKSVVAWIECRAYGVHPYGAQNSRETEELYFNPRQVPYWISQDGENIDNREDEALYTIGRKVYSQI